MPLWVKVTTKPSVPFGYVPLVTGYLQAAAMAFEQGIIRRNDGFLHNNVTCDRLDEGIEPSSSRYVGNVTRLLM
jgi:hypothetical protein